MKPYQPLYHRREWKEEGGTERLFRVTAPISRRPAFAAPFAHQFLSLEACRSMSCRLQKMHITLFPKWRRPWRCGLASLSPWSRTWKTNKWLCWCSWQELVQLPWSWLVLVSLWLFPFFFTYCLNGHLWLESSRKCLPKSVHHPCDTINDMVRATFFCLRRGQQEREREKEMGLLPLSTGGRAEQMVIILSWQALSHSDCDKKRWDQQPQICANMTMVMMMKESSENGITRFILDSHSQLWVFYVRYSSSSAQRREFIMIWRSILFKSYFWATQPLSSHPSNNYSFQSGKV